VVLPAPDGPTRAVSWPDGARKLTSCRTPAAEFGRSGAGSAIDSSEASDTSDADGYRNDTSSNSICGATSRRPSPGTRAGRVTAPGRSAISGFRSSTSKTRSKLTSAVITLICTLDSWAIGA
jgi:hypothetical protein